VAQNSFVVDKAGNLWSPDTYFSGGQLAADKIDIGGTDDPGLYGGERYGNFSFALPVDQGTYALTLYFAEKYWGTNISKKGGTGSRVFDVLCNGIALARNMDIAKEVGPGRAYKRIFHELRFGRCSRGRRGRTVASPAKSWPSYTSCKRLNERS